MVKLGRFGILADGRPIRLGGRAFDVLMALIEASGVVVSKDELLSRVRQGRIVDENRRPGTTAALCKGFSADRALIPMVADGFTRSPAGSARPPVRRSAQIAMSVSAAAQSTQVAGGPQPPLIDRQKESALALSAVGRAFCVGSPEQGDPDVLAAVLARVAAAH
jgi:hypothetical protein